jgi:hypothetical protein
MDSSYGYYETVEAQQLREKAAARRQSAERRANINRFLKTLRRVPDDIILSTIARDLDLNDANSCLCGTFMREKICQMKDVAFERTSSGEMHSTTGMKVPGMCALLFGGTKEEWDDVFMGVTYESDAPLIEEALMRRVDEAVG